MEVFFHVYCRKDYQKIIREKINKFKASGLWKEIKTLWIPVSGVREEDQEFLKTLKLYSPKIKVFEHQNPVFNNEPDTLNFMKIRAENFESNTPMLYIHTKGVSHDHPILKRNVEAWVRYLDLWCIGHWKECIDALKEGNVAGGFLIGIDGENPHYQGNFFWANSHYIRTLPTIDQENIQNLARGEFWICSGKNPNPKNIGYKPDLDLYQNYYCQESDFIEGF